MRRIELSILKARCLRWAVQNEMRVLKLDDEAFHAESKDSIIMIDYLSIYRLVSQDWTVEEVLDNETCYNEAV